MESHCKELESLADQMEKQAAAETEPEPLVELAEEMEYKKENVASMAQALKETIPAEFKERAQQAIRDSAKIAEEGKRWLGDLRARLEFRSTDSEAGSYKFLFNNREGIVKFSRSLGLLKAVAFVI